MSVVDGTDLEMNSSKRVVNAEEEVLQE